MEMFTDGNLRLEEQPPPCPKFASFAQPAVNTFTGAAKIWNFQTRKNKRWRRENPSCCSGRWTGCAARARWRH
jgi:hypothetical protein